MPYRILVRPDLRLVLVIAAGVMPAAEFIAAARATADHRDFQRDFRQIVDLRGVTEIRPTPVEIQRMAELSPYAPGARRALVAGSDLGFGMARMYEMLLDPPSAALRVVRTLDEAITWVGLDDQRDGVLAALRSIRVSP